MLRPARKSLPVNVLYHQGIAASSVKVPAAPGTTIGSQKRRLSPGSR
ncbi:hypothetical protein [Streptomyces sp. SudanB66_2053]